jgi:hypothetical protein
VPPTSAGAARTASQKLMTQIAVVYTETASTGKYTTVFLATLACRLVRPKALIAAASTGARVELLADKDLWFDPDVTIPEQCRVLIDGVYWQPRAGSFENLGDGVTVVAHRCMVIRIQTAAFT